MCIRDSLQTGDDDNEVRYQKRGVEEETKRPELPVMKAMKSPSNAEKGSAPLFGRNHVANNEEDQYKTKDGAMLISPEGQRRRSTKENRNIPGAKVEALKENGKDRDGFLTKLKGFIDAIMPSASRCDANNTTKKHEVIYSHSKAATGKNTYKEK
eukprot:TRINITY_DN5261_c0_g2_i2.p1 TRINITY_DN5261_c0_g2~~TRINITY_DN5261_c0_g2_i2.p1  ORF type:complete len:155 (-),score=39.54 TRINITY_DN5261_c0_g2_i2:80-544(-)